MVKLRGGGQSEFSWKHFCSPDYRSVSIVTETTRSSIFELIFVCFGRFKHEIIFWFRIAVKVGDVGFFHSHVAAQSHDKPVVGDPLSAKRYPRFPGLGKSPENKK